jgi:hypothetical protein
MGWMPGAVRVPYSYTGRPRRRKGRGVVFHIAVSEQENLRPWGVADWHFYVSKRGTIYQYIDTDFMAYAAADANSTMVMVETQGGVRNADSEPLTPAQVEAWAKIAAYVHKDEGAPLRLMQNSLATERGIGWHKLGVDPWRVPGGQRWSLAYGKICPGAAKIKQMPEVLARAKQIVSGAPAPKPKPKRLIDMFLFQVEGGSTVYLLSPLGYHFIDSGAFANELRERGVPFCVIPASTHRNFVEHQNSIHNIARLQQAVAKLTEIDAGVDTIAQHYVVEPEPEA